MKLDKMTTSNMQIPHLERETISQRYTIFISFGSARCSFEPSRQLTLWTLEIAPSWRGLLMIDFCNVLLLAL